MNSDSSRAAWPEAIATVTACHYEFGAGQALAFGIPTTKHFRIAFNYWAPNSDGTAKLHTGEFSSEKAIPQNTLFPIRYNPTSPHEHTHSASNLSPRMPLIAIGIVGSIILSLAWAAILHSCH